MKIFLSNISNNEISPDENFPDYGSQNTSNKCACMRINTTNLFKQPKSVPEMKL